MSELTKQGEAVTPEKADSRIARERRAAIGDMKATLQSPFGRRTMMRLLRMTDVMSRQPILQNGGPTGIDVARSAYTAGERSLGHEILWMVSNADAGAFEDLTTILLREQYTHAEEEPDDGDD